MLSVGIVLILASIAIIIIIGIVCYKKIKRFANLTHKNASFEGKYTLSNDIPRSSNVADNATIATSSKDIPTSSNLAYSTVVTTSSKGIPMSSNLAYGTAVTTSSNGIPTSSNVAYGDTTVTTSSKGIPTSSNVAYSTTVQSNQPDYSSITPSLVVSSNPAYQQVDQENPTEYYSYVIEKREDSNMPIHVHSNLAYQTTQHNQADSSENEDHVYY